MREPCQHLEGKLLPIPLISFAPALLVMAWVLARNSVDPVAIPLALLLAAVGNLYSLLSTGWAMGQWSRAAFRRGGEYSAFYWAQVGFFAVFGLLSLAALTLLLLGAA